MKTEYFYLAFCAFWACGSPAEPEIISRPYNIEDLKPYWEEFASAAGLVDVYKYSKSSDSRTYGDKVIENWWEWTVGFRDDGARFSNVHHTLSSFGTGRLYRADYSSDTEYYNEDDFARYIDTVWAFLSQELRDWAKENIQYTKTVQMQEEIDLNRFTVAVGSGHMTVTIDYKFVDGWGIMPNKADVPGQAASIESGNL